MRNDRQRLLRNAFCELGVMESPSKRLQWARKRAGFDSATEAARSRGWPVSTYLGHENGDRVPSREKAKQYARAFKVRWEWLLEGEGAPTGGANLSPIVGYVGAGSEIIPFDDHEKGAGLDEIESPPGAPANAIAVTVRGNSMYPRYFDGESLFYLAEHRAASEMLGRECVVKLTDGRMLVKIVRRGTKPHLYNLESWNHPTLEDQEVEWAAAVKWRG